MTSPNLALRLAIRGCALEVLAVLHGSRVSDRLSAN
jgi:hypothetical protein